MKRILLVVIAVLLVGGAIWALSGGVTRMAEKRIEQELALQGLPQPLAECMARRMADRLTILQLRKLERLAPEDGETGSALTMAGLLERVRQVDDREVLEVTAGSAAVCAFAGG